MSALRRGLGRIPLSATGWWALAGTSTCYGLGVWLGYPLLVVVAAAGGVALLVAVTTVAVPAKMAVRRTVAPDRLSVGEPAVGRLTARNLGRWTSPGFVAVDRVGEVALELPVSPVGPGARRSVQYTVPTGRRGRLAVGPVTVERRDPLGLLRRVQPHGQEDTLWVRPRVRRLAPVPIGVLLDTEGSRPDAAARGSATFVSLREYVPGDDPRQVHWRSSARTGVLMVREHVDTTEPTTTVLLDARTSVLDPARFEQAVEMVASVVAAAEGGRRPVVLRCVGEDQAAMALAGAVTMLDRLAAVEADPDAEPGALLKLAEAAVSGGALVVVTGELEPGTVARVAAQGRRFSPVVLVELADAAEVAVSRPAGMTVLRGPTVDAVALAWNRLVVGTSA